MFTTGGGNVPAQPAMTYRWTFDEPGAANNFIAALGQWGIASEPTAPSSPNVMRQTGRYGDPDFPRTIVKDLVFTDLTVRVRCRPESGDIDRACGLMFRLKDSDNYYLTRANANEDNVRLYRVVGGNRQQFAGADLRVTAGQWHTLEATAMGDTLAVSWDGRPVIMARDSTFTAGKNGLWTKADSVTAFDDLEATAH